MRGRRHGRGRGRRHHLRHHSPAVHVHVHVRMVRAHVGLDVWHGERFVVVKVGEMVVDVVEAVEVSEVELVHGDVVRVVEVQPVRGGRIQRVRHRARVFSLRRRERWSVRRGGLVRAIMPIWEVTCRGGRGGETRGATGPDRPGCRSIARGRVQWGHGLRSGRGGGCRARSRAGIARASLRAHHQTPKPPKRTAVSKTFERECRRTDLPTASAPTRHPTRAVEDGIRTCQPCAPARRVRGWSPVA